MFSLHDRATRLCDGVSRREWLRVGGLSALGLSLPQLLRAAGAESGDPRTTARAATGDPRSTLPLAAGLDGAGQFGRAKNVIFLWLQGGPPQHETFDPKPNAPAEIRGLFNPIATNVPGIQFCELLPRTARIADKLAIVRSLHTDDENHDVSGFWVLTGYPYGPGSARQIKPSDWPYMGSVIKMLKPSERMPALTSVWLPDLMRLNDNVRPAGQTAGFLGPLWEPERFVGDPSADDYQIEGLGLPAEVPALRLNGRASLLAQLENHLRRVDRDAAIGEWDQLSQNAFDLLTSGRAREAFAIQREPDRVRERYGRHQWGQSVLLARRLIEAGVRLVHVNWVREPGDTAVDNPMWDTHAQNADRLQDVLCPLFDVSFTALIEDLEQRGLLAETLVVAIGEFGRTPKINAQGGRDHWGRVFSFALAGAGISGGQVYGASDRNGGYPAKDPIRPHDLTATIFHLLGIDHHGSFHDRSGRPQLLTKGAPLERLLGNGPVTAERTAPGGDVALVPAYDDRKLGDVDFSSGQPLVSCETVTRTKGWRAWPVEPSDGPMQVRFTDPVPGEPRRTVLIGWGLVPGEATISIPQGTRALLGQEIRNPRGGQFTFHVRAAGGGTSPEAYRQFLDHVTCRLALLRFGDTNKDLRTAEVLASATIRPAYAAISFQRAAISGQEESPDEFSLSEFLGSRMANENFPIGQGLAVAIVVEKTTPGELELPAGQSAFLEIVEAQVEFSAQPRNELGVV